MRKVWLYIAMSLDGYIADSAGGVGWLDEQAAVSESGEDSYAEFIRGIDTVLLGWNTYHQIVTELSPGEWVYGGLTSYVFTHRAMPSTDEIRFTDSPPAVLVRRLRAARGKDIWVCGGANLARQLVGAELIDRYCITVVPVLLGDGVRLFDGLPLAIRLRPLGARTLGGMTELLYARE